jgi:hypothetical protein
MTIRKISALFAAVLTTGISVLFSAQASAVVSPAMQACLSGESAQAGSDPVIGSTPDAPPSNFYGYPNAIWTGDVIRVTASGSIKIGGWPWDPSFDPTGSTEMADSSFPALQRKYALVGEFGMYYGRQNKFLLFGTNSGCIQNTGQATFLYMIINDSRTTDNSGSWQVHIKHYYV